MKIEINDKQEQVLLSRTQLNGAIGGYNTTPSIDQVRKKIAEITKSDENNVVIRNIKGEFGKRTAKFSAFIYKNQEMKNKVELKQGKKALEKLQKKQGSESGKQAEESKDQKQESKESKK